MILEGYKLSYKAFDSLKNSGENKIVNFENFFLILSVNPTGIVDLITTIALQFTFSTKYPIAKVWGFFGKGCCLGCSLDPKDCCAGYKRLLMEELY